MTFTCYYTSKYVSHCLEITPSTVSSVSLSRKRNRLSAILGIARLLCFLAKQSTSTVHTISTNAPSSFTRNVFARKQPGGRRWRYNGRRRRRRERASRRNAVVRWFRRTTWKEVGENPWERSCEGRGGGGCTSGEHRGREEACCKEYKQCVLIRAPWPDECTIVTLQGFATPPRPRPAPVPRPKLACAVYQMPRSQMKLIFLTCRGGMVYFRGILIGTMRRIRNFPRRKTSSNRIFPSIRSSVCPARKGIKKRKEIDGEEGRFLSVQLFVREEREKRRKVSSPPPPDDNRSLVEDERVRGSPEHVTIIPSRGGYTYTCRIRTGGVRGKAEHVTGLRNGAPLL